MTTIRSAKSKGSNFELSCKDSLKPIYGDIQRFGGEGFVHQVDLVSEKRKTCFECKRHKAFSWNELTRYFAKLKVYADQKRYTPYLLFQANNQPCLVMYNGLGQDSIRVTTFEMFFEVEYKKRGDKHDTSHTLEKDNVLL